MQKRLYPFLVLFLTLPIGWVCVLGKTVEQQNTEKDVGAFSNRNRSCLIGCFRERLPGFSCLSCNESVSSPFDQSESQTFDLNRNLVKPVKLEGNNSQRRESVITRTPNESPLGSRSNSPSRTRTSSNSTQESFHSEKSTFSTFNQILSNKMEEEENIVEIKVANVEDKMLAYSVDDLTVERLPYFDDDIASFKLTLEETIAAINSLCVTYKNEVNDEKKTEWKTLKTTTINNAKIYTNAMYKKAYELRASLPSQEEVRSRSVEGTGNDDFQSQSLELKKQELQIREKALAAKEKENADKASELLHQAAIKKTAAISKAKHKADAIVDDCKLLADKIDIEFLGDFSDIEIGRMMKDIKTWEEDISKIIEMRRDLESIVDSNGLLEEDSRVEEMKVLVSSLHTELKAIIEAVKIEDGVRELYTLDGSKNEKVVLPVFEGREDEDYFKWKE